MAIGKALAVSVVFVSLMAGLGYWLIVLFQTKFPNLKYDLKYKILRKKYNENDVRKLLQYMDANMSADDVEKLILLSPENRKSPSEVKEVIYIYNQINRIERRGQK